MNYNDIINYIDNDNDKNVDALYKELKYKINIDLLNFIFYDKFEYEYIEDEIIEQQIIENENKEETIEEREKRQDTLYRNIIQNKYKRCMITGKPLFVSQVAHIYPHKLCNQEEKYDINNGLLLSAELHILFDSTDNKLKIDPETQIISFSKEILEDETMSYYRQYHNKKINLDDKQIYYLKKKYFYKKNEILNI